MHLSTPLSAALALLATSATAMPADSPGVTVYNPRSVLGVSLDKRATVISIELRPNENCKGDYTMLVGDVNGCIAVPYATRSLRYHLDNGNMYVPSCLPCGVCCKVGD